MMILGTFMEILMQCGKEGGIYCSAASFKEVSRYVFLTFRSWGLLKYDFSAFFSIYVFLKWMSFDGRG